MKKMMKTACALAVLAASCNVMAESVDMRVTGAVTPIACKPTFSDNGVADYGDLNTNMLSKDDVTMLPFKHLTLSIDCSAPAKIALLATNARPGTTLGLTEEGESGFARAINDYGMGQGGGVAGLGLDGDKKIGAYGVVIMSSSMDGVLAGGLRSNDRAVWTNSYNSTFFSDQGKYKYISFRATGTPIEPSAFKNLNVNLRVSTYINKSTELDLTKPVKLDGQTNFEMFYL